MAADVGNFIKRFTEHESTSETFLNGCCYWFAYILYRRFLRQNSRIMYDQVENHFGTQIGGRVYDISGDVTTKYDWIPWEELGDDMHKSRIVRDCIMF